MSPTQAASRSGPASALASLLAPGEQLPDYAGGDLGALVRSVAAATGGQVADGLRDTSLASALAARSRTLLCLVDGLGTAALDAGAPTLAAHRKAELTSVFPSATASAITTLMTGRAPREHGVSGWRVRLPSLGTTIAPLPFRPDGGKLGRALHARASHALFEVPAWWSALPTGAVHLVMPAKLTRGPYTETHAGRAAIHGFDGWRNGVAKAAALLARPGTRFVYLYWPDYDHLAHDHGICGEQTLAHLASIDAGFEALLERCAGLDASVVVTADHGFVDTTPSDWLDIDEQPRITDLLAHSLTGEPRVAFAHLADGVAAGRVELAVHAAFGDSVRVVPSQALMEGGWFGPCAPNTPDADARLRERIGDLTLLPRGHGCVFHGERKNKVPMIGIHGGLSQDEMRIPLVLVQP